MTAGRGRRRKHAPATGAPEAPRPAAPALAIAGVLVTFAAVFLALEIVSYTQKSATWDEPIHLTAGYVALVTGDQRVDPTHPPFLRMWAALPLTLMKGVSLDTSAIDRSSIRAWLAHDAYAFAHAFLYGHNDADRLLYRARFMIVLLGVALGVLLFAWVYEWLGFPAAVLAIVLYTVSPNIAAHASLVTTDFGVTCFFFGAVYFLWRTFRRLSAPNVAGLAVCTSLAIVTKFSAVILLPVIVVLLAVAVRSGSPIRPRAAMGICLVLGMTIWIAIWAVYGFRYAPSDSPAWLMTSDGTAGAVPRAAAVGLAWVDAHHLLPNAFTQGFLLSVSSAQHVGVFLAGEVSTRGRWYYLPLAFLLKTPLPYLVMLAAGLIVYVARRRRFGPANEAFVVVPVAAYLAVSIASGISLGVRHLLPIYPFVLIIAAGAGRELAARGVVGRLALATLTGILVVRFAAVYPHMLTYFNPLAGGPRGGHRYLVDSNLDWGQHLKLLKAWMDDHKVEHINLAYFGTADPGYYGIDCTYLPGGPSFAVDAIMSPTLPGYVAVSETVLSGVYLQPHWRLFYRELATRVPVAEIGNTIRVYWLDRWPVPRPVTTAAALIEPENERRLADALLFGLRWNDEAIVHYRRYLTARPQASGALVNLGVALARSGQVDAALMVFRRAVRANPSDALAHRYLAAALLRSRDGVVEAMVHAQQAVHLAGTDADARDVLGRTLAILGRFDEADAEFRRALEIDPSNRGARVDLDRLTARRRQ